MENIWRFQCKKTACGTQCFISWACLSFKTKWPSYGVHNETENRHFSTASTFGEWQWRGKSWVALFGYIKFTVFFKRISAIKVVHSKTKFYWLDMMQVNTSKIASNNKFFLFLFQTGRIHKRSVFAFGLCSYCFTKKNFSRWMARKGGFMGQVIKFN